MIIETKVYTVANIRAKISLKIAQIRPVARNITVKPVVPMAYLSAKNARRKKRKNSL